MAVHRESSQPMGSADTPTPSTSSQFSTPSLLNRYRNSSETTTQR
jgi:hypothetical protein